MAMIEMSSVLVKRACEEKLEKIGFVKGRLREYIDMSIYNIQIFGKDMQKVENEEKSVKLILKISERLELAGFDVDQTDENTLNVSWGA